MFRSPKQDADDMKRIQQQRQHVLWLQDQITLATYHKRPAHEVVKLLDQLRAATRPSC